MRVQLASAICPVTNLPSCAEYHISGNVSLGSLVGALADQRARTEHQEQPRHEHAERDAPRKSQAGVSQALKCPRQNAAQPLGGHTGRPDGGDGGQKILANHGGGRIGLPERQKISVRPGSENQVVVQQERDSPAARLMFAQRRGFTGGRIQQHLASAGGP